MPSRLPRFGFEAEFGEGGAALVTELASRGFLANSTMCGWHCDCEVCRFENSDYSLKAQTDSTCPSGCEIISKPLRSIADARPLMTALESAAVEVDAAPSLDAGLHVHVELPRDDRSTLAPAFWQYLRWEPFLSWLAAGRFEAIRYQNHPVLSTGALGQRIVDEYRSHNPDSSRYTESQEALRWLNDNGYNDEDNLACELLEFHQQRDRHSYLNVQARRQPTWEFRLWNSTRSAWRMEMFVGVSRAFMLPAFVDALSSETPASPEDDACSGVFISALNSVDLGQTAALVSRQVAYQNVVDRSISTEFARL